jgi:hypothetical protein
MTTSPDFAAGNVVIDWLHAEGFPIRTVVSGSLLAFAPPTGYC